MSETISERISLEIQRQSAASLVMKNLELSLSDIKHTRKIGRIMREYAVVSGIAYLPGALGSLFVFKQGLYKLLGCGLSLYLSSKGVWPHYMANILELKALKMNQLGYNIRQEYLNVYSDGPNTNEYKRLSFEYEKGRHELEMINPDAQLKLLSS